MTDDDLAMGRIVLAVTAEPAATAQAETLIASHPGARAVTIGWDAVGETLSQMPAPAAVLADAEGASGAQLASLAELVASCTADGVPAIVLFTAAQLDEVAGALLGSEAVLLCDADEGERATALAVALADQGHGVRESSYEARRRQRIQEEVARFAAALTRIVDRESGGAGEAPAADPFVAERGGAFAPQDAAIDPAELRRTIRARRMRDDAFGLPGLFEDPAWDMLLDLFAAALERRQVSVSSLCIAAAVAPTTALRWIGKLIDAGLLQREPDAFDRRRAYISLTARAATGMRDYVVAVRRAGLALA